MTAGMANYTSYWNGDVRVEIVCMRPTTVTDGSTKPPSISELLNDKNAAFPKNQTKPQPSGANSVTHGYQDARALLLWVSCFYCKFSNYLPRFPYTNEISYGKIKQ
jgi:hypothetical protein